MAERIVLTAPVVQCWSCGQFFPPGQTVRRQVMAETEVGGLH